MVTDLYGRSSKLLCRYDVTVFSDAFPYIHDAGYGEEFKEANVARAPLAKSSRQVSAETDKAPCEPTAVLWRNKKADPQCKPIDWSLMLHI